MSAGPGGATLPPRAGLRGKRRCNSVTYPHKIRAVSPKTVKVRYSDATLSFCAFLGVIETHLVSKASRLQQNDIEKHESSKISRRVLKRSTGRRWFTVFISELMSDVLWEHYIRLLPFQSHRCCVTRSSDLNQKKNTGKLSTMTCHVCVLPRTM